MIKDLLDLDIRVEKCNNCFIQRNGHNIPKWTEKTKYVMFTEFLYKNKPDFMIKFWELAGRMGLKEEHFLQIGTVQCSPDVNKRTKKYNRPSHLHRTTCEIWFNEYLKVIKPKKMLAFGNFPMERLTGKIKGIAELNSTVIKPKINQVVVPTVLSLPPSILIYPENEKLIKQSLKQFKEL
jgi:uracil-DNA glycosylase family 4